MTFRTILTVLTDPAQVRGTLDRAIALAEAQGAHLDVLCLGVERSNLGQYYEAASAIALQASIERAAEEAAEITEAARKVLAPCDLRHATETAVAQMVDVGRQVAARAALADLAVLPLPYGPDQGVEQEPVIEAALFDAHCPVMALPATDTFAAEPKRILLAWNESAEAMRAVRAALPLLRAAGRAEVVVIDPPAHGANRSDPGGQLAQFLSRHGVTAEIDVQARTLPRVSDVLKRHATERGCDLVVKGAYGHSRFREAILGGATRDMLTDAPVPVLLAH